MAETIYPQNIISRKGWKKGIEAIDILNNCPNAIIGHWVKGTFDSCVDNSLGEGMERLSEEALPTKDLPNLSCSLLGALYMFENQIRIMPGIQTEVVDTTGAGDIFRAGFAYALAQNYDLEKSITFANIAAGLSTRKLGGASSIPDLTEVNSYMASKYEIKNDNNEQNTAA